MRRRVSKLLSPWRQTHERGGLPLDTSKPAVVVVSHEASATGAPILSLNLGDALAERYLVLQLVLGQPGALSPALREQCHWLVHSGGPWLTRTAWRRIRASLPSELDVRFALVNSVVAFPALETLRREGIAGIALVHEFATYIRPPLTSRQACLEAALWSDELVFSASITRDDALRHWPALHEGQICVLPQGQSRAPGQASLVQPLSHADNHQEPLPPGLERLGYQLSTRTGLLLGVGAVQPRKGVDLFISMAQQLERLAPDPNRLYIWLGGGYQPDNDLTVSIWLEDQIERSGLSQQLVILQAPHAYNWLMQRCTLFILSSRLDPLPNVVIDATLAGKPVLAFNQASGFATLLAEHEELSDTCLAPYLDTRAMAEQAAALLGDPCLCKRVAEASQHLGEQHFRMHDYMSQLTAKGEQACKDMRTEQEELKRLIAHPNGINARFIGLPRRWSRQHLTHHYLRQWRSRILPRKPQPGFHPALYAESVLNKERHQDPLLHWLDNGRPAGPWKLPLITPSDPRPRVREAPSVGVHIHVYYEELLEPILEGIRHNRIKPKFVLSMSDTSLAREVERKLTQEKWEILDIRCLPNRGRDLGPLVNGIGKLLESHCEIYAHLHTKGSRALNPHLVKRWRRFLLEQLLGTRAKPMADRIVHRMLKDSQLGLVFPDDPSAIGWDGNRKAAVLVARRLGIPSLPQHIHVPVGSMFWARRGALTPLYNLDWAIDAWPPEPLPIDGTVLHAIERLIPQVCSHAGYSSAVCHVPGISR